MFVHVAQALVEADVPASESPAAPCLQKCQLIGQIPRQHDSDRKMAQNTPFCIASTPGVQGFSVAPVIHTVGLSTPLIELITPSSRFHQVRPPL